YCLTYEEDTDFLARFQRGEFAVCDEDDAHFFETASAMLGAAGYEHYEISNFAQPGFRSLHNQAYWRGTDYLGLGPSAFSTIASHRWQNLADHREYARRLFANESPVATREELTAAMKRTEHIALGLRTCEGILADVVCDQRVDELISAGLLQQTAGRLALTSA